MMKKYLCFIILITVLCSCSSTLEPENYSELGPSRLGNGFSWTETEKAWILADYPNDFFSYYDKAYGGVDIFCAKPDCLHDDENCGAYATRLSPALIQYYGGKIYYYAEYDHKNGKNGIFRMQPDGTKRELVKSITRTEDGPMAGSVQRIAIHRDRVFAFCWLSGVEDDTPINEINIYSWPLGDTAADRMELVLSRRSETALDGFVRFDSDRLVFAVYDSGVKTLTVISADAATMELSTLLEAENVNYVSDMWAHGDVWFSMALTTDDMVCFYRLSDGGLEKIYAADDRNGSYNGVYITNGITVSAGNFNGENIPVLIRDFDGGVIFEGALPVDFVGAIVAEAEGDVKLRRSSVISMYFLYRDGKLQYFFMSTIDGNRYGSCVYDLTDGGLEEKLLWLYPKGETDGA